MHFQRWVLSGIIFCGVCLLLLVFSIPAQEIDFHRAYVKNLNRLMSLSGELERDELRVHMGVVRHYDFIEADLQEMEKAIALAGFMPSFVDNEYREFVEDSQRNYRQRLGSIRNLVDISKRTVGLVRNSDRSIKEVFRQIRKLADGVPEALFVLSELQQGVQEQIGEARSQALVERTIKQANLPGDLAAQLRAHVGILSRFQPQTKANNRKINRMLLALDMPEALHSKYQLQYHQHNQQTRLLVWLSNGVGTLLVVLCFLLIRQLQAAKKRAEHGAQQVEVQMVETHNAVDDCNQVLQKISQGCYVERVKRSYDGDLALLCQGVNEAAERVEVAMVQLGDVMSAIELGQFHVRMGGDIEGELRHQVERAMSLLEQTLSDIVDVMDNMRSGQFKTRVGVETKGNLAHLKNAVNESMNALELAIDEITAVMRAQASGDLSLRIEREMPGQLGTLRDSINSSTEKLEAIIGDLREACLVVGSVGEQVQEQSQFLSAHSSEQVAVLTETVHSTEEMTRAIVANRELTQTASLHADEARTQVSAGETVAGEAIHTMETVLGASQKINDVTEMINEIAFQTHMLALNAAVEAARASQQGAGFAVVAREVGSLAQRCSDSSAEIKALIEENVDQIHRGVGSVRNTGAVLSRIAGAIGQVNKAVEEIHLHCDEQSRHIDTVNASLGKVDSLTQHNAQLAQQSLQSAERLNAHANQLQHIVTFFRT